MAEQIQYVTGTKLPKYLTEGFTVTMWVRFMDKVNSGTLFNYANPLRVDNPSGFMLETFVLQQDEINPPAGSSGENFFVDENAERFIRLVVREGDGSLRDSHLGKRWSPRMNTGRNIGTGNIPPLDAIPDLNNPYEARLYTHTRVPIDFDEWYFVVASYDPTINEVDSYGMIYDLDAIPESGDETIYETDDNFWKGNIDPATDAFVNRSGYGARCKVEIISKSDLLRARGFKQKEE